MALLPLRVLTWNLMHGRSVPAAGRDLFEEFATALDGWEWDLALLQEVPPWWPAALGSRLGAASTLVLTSRNFGFSARRAVAVRWPDMIKSNGGGCNAILTRGMKVLERRTLRLAVLPERRWLLGARVGPVAGLNCAAVWVGNVHLSGWPPGAAGREARRAAAALAGWASTTSEAIVLGGDFNLPAPALDGFAVAGGFYVDHAFVRGLSAVGVPVLPDRGTLSDHAPVLVTLA